MTIKQEALQALNTLPESTTWDEVIYTLYVRQKIGNGINDINEGKTVTQEEAKARILAK